MNTKKRVSLISQLNVFRLVYRSVLLLSGIALYLVYRFTANELFNFLNPGSVLAIIALAVLTLLLGIEMFERLFPVNTSSMGSQKQFKKNFRPSNVKEPVLQPAKATVIVVVSWVALNLAFGILYFLHIIDGGVLVLISLFYAVSDMICILFFCPFQTWMMHNRCCGTCRIYNWDFVMMTTPLFILFIPYSFNIADASWTMHGWFEYANPFLITMVVLSLIIFIVWEVTYRRHPERFSDATNLSIRCGFCQERLCAHKKQLQVLLKDSKKLIRGFYSAEERDIQAHKTKEELEKEEQDKNVQ